VDPKRHFVHTNLHIVHAHILSQKCTAVRLDGWTNGPIQKTNVANMLNSSDLKSSWKKLQLHTHAVITDAGIDQNITSQCLK
jgi:hypothetical protein